MQRRPSIATVVVSDLARSLPGRKIHVRYLLSVLLLVLAVSAHADELTVTDPWIREVPSVSRHSAGYMTLMNADGNDRELVAVETPLFERAELHESIEEDGMARMRHVVALTVPAGGEVALEPGGYHLMLMNRQVESLESGDSVPMTLRFDDGSKIDVVAEVRRDAPRGGGHGHHH